ncbi:MAG: hypothetical protein KJO64_00310, partial [Bacteroidia bacterium]|nr:hypothetical protein [Bacteroidia bacterium]
MLEGLPIYISAVFIITIALTLWFFQKANKGNRLVSLILLIWIVLQSFVSYSGFYTLTDSLPPRFGLLPIPALITIILLLSTTKGRSFIFSLDEKWLT